VLAAAQVHATQHTIDTERNQAMLKSILDWLSDKKTPAAKFNELHAAAAAAHVPAAPEHGQSDLVFVGKTGAVLSSIALIELDGGWNIESILADVPVDGKVVRMRIRALVCPTRRHAWQQMPRLSAGNRLVCPPCVN